MIERYPVNDSVKFLVIHVSDNTTKAEKEIVISTIM
jgi:hypothetical protein